MSKRSGGFPGGRYMGGMGGMGGGNMQQLLRQAQKMQEDMTNKQEELAARSYTATAGGGVVQATVSGEKKLTGIQLAPEVVDPEDIDMLQDLLVAAINAAMDQANADAEQEMGKITGGMMPGMF